MDKRKDLINYLNLKLAMLGQSSEQELGMAGTIINEQIVQNRLNEKSYAPVDKRIQSFINEQLKDYKSDFKLDLPIETLILDQAGMARELSLPVDKNEYHTDIIESYRLQHGVLHNPKHDRRTTKGVFHVVEDGLAIPDDKKAVPKYVFAQFVEKAFNNVPSELKQLPFTATQEEKPELFVSLLLKPLVSPKVEGYISEKRMEVRFIVPANLVANLDFVENIFGNGGNPFFPENDSALNPDAWTGHIEFRSVYRGTVGRRLSGRLVGC